MPVLEIFEDLAFARADFDFVVVVVVVLSSSPSVCPLADDGDDGEVTMIVSVSTSI